MPSIPRSVPVLCGLALVLGVASCALSPLDPQDETHRYPSYGLEDAQPADIAVVPVRDRTPEGTVPVRDIRRHLYEGLAERLYSPLRLNYVDVNWVEAGFDASALGADGILQVDVEEWDTSLLSTHGAIRVVVQAEILDGQRPGSTPLWGARLKRRFEVASGTGEASHEEVYARAAARLAAEVLAMIPRREPGAR